MEDGKARDTGWRIGIGCLIFVGHLPQKSPILSGSFAERDPQLEACCSSSPPCNSKTRRAITRILWIQNVLS